MQTENYPANNNPRVEVLASLTLDENGTIVIDDESTMLQESDENVIDFINEILMVCEAEETTNSKEVQNSAAGFDFSNTSDLVKNDKIRSYFLNSRTKTNQVLTLNAKGVNKAEFPSSTSNTTQPST